jgi:hypothetical protein
MKKLVSSLMFLSVILITFSSCKNNVKKEITNPATGSSEAGTGLIVVARDIITEVILRPDTLGDPWEVEKVRNYDGKLMFTSLFENIYSKKVTVYDIGTDAPLNPNDVRKLEEAFGSDLTKIAKIQFLEDWYFDPGTNKIIKKIKSASFGYEYSLDPSLPVRYKALFRLNIDQ